MSVEYYLVCEDHNECAWCCSDGVSGPQMQGGKTAAAFIITHRNCTLTVIDEHAEGKFDDLDMWDHGDWEKRLDYGKQ